MEKMLAKMTTEERGNMTIDQFEAEYGFTLEDIKQLGWLENMGSLDTPTWHCVEDNDCPASIFFFDPVWLDVPEIRKDTAGILADILGRHYSEKNLHLMGQSKYGWIHCFEKDCKVYCAFQKQDSKLDIDCYDIKKIRTNKEPTYVLEYMTNAGKLYKEFTRAEAIEYIKNNPEYLTRQVANIIEICKSTVKRENKWLRYDIDVIKEDAERLLTTLKLLGYEN